jgi:acyl carrier protein
VPGSQVARSEPKASEGQQMVSDPSFRACAVIPTYDNPATVRSVVEKVRAHLPDIVVVDDGSGPAGRAACDALASSGLARVEHRAQNGGKGAAVKTGFAAAQRLGATHVLQVDADGQHDLGDIPRFLAEARAHPDALILGRPVFDATQPRSRAFARQLSIFWVNVETGSPRDCRPAVRVSRLPARAPRSLRARAATTWSSIWSCRCAWSGRASRCGTCPRACATCPRTRAASRISTWCGTPRGSRGCTSGWRRSRRARPRPPARREAVSLGCALSSGPCRLRPPHLRATTCSPFSAPPCRRSSGSTPTRSSPPAHLIDDLDLDSIDLVDLAVSLEQDRGIKLDEEDLKSVRTVGDAVDAVRAALARSAAGGR